MNHHLRAAMVHARLQPLDLAAHLGVDPKTVDRWLKGRIPYPRHRWAVADFLHVDEADLWPEVTGACRAISPEVLAVYSHRWAVPKAVWRDLFAGATSEIDILTYSGLFLAEDTSLVRILADQARADVRLRILIGDPDSSTVAARGTEEGIGADVMAARVKNALALLRPLREVAGVEIRLHATVLYNSIYRADDQLLVNSHAYGTPAAQAPVMHLRQVDSEGASAVYLASFERVWTAAEP